MISLWWRGKSDTECASVAGHFIPTDKQEWRHDSPFSVPKAETNGFKITVLVLWSKRHSIFMVVFNSSESKNIVVS